MPEQTQDGAPPLPAGLKVEEFLEFAPDAIVGVDASGTIKVVNKQAESVFGYPRAELLGQPVESLVPERFRAVHPGHRTGYFGDPRTRPMGAELDLYGRRRDGTEFPAEISLSSIETDDGRLGIAAVRDITERREAELKLEQFLEFAPDAIVGVDPEGTIMIVNKQAESVFGYAREELLGQPVETLVPERFRAVHPGHRSGYFLDPRTRPMGADLELYGLRKDGTEFPAEISLSSIETSEGTLGIAAVRDITERHEAELKFEQFLEFAPDAIVGVDPEGKIMIVNRQAESVFGYAREELLGQPVETLVPERFRSVHPGHRTGYFADPRTRPMGAQLDLYGLRKDGTEFPAEISLSSIETEEGLLATAAVRDVSERVQAEHEREALEVQLREARSVRMESVGQLAGGIAHDFNNLLGVILNYADFAANELDDRPEVRNDVDEVRRAARQAAELTRKLLVFSRREIVQPKPLELNEVVGEMESLLRRTLGNHIELDTTFGSNLPSVLADPGELEQVLVNLAVNSRDAMPDGGKLRITTARRTLDENYVASHPEASAGNFVELAVEDTGSGMTAETMARAFEPFYTTKGQGEGTGLGLATVYGIVRRAGGSIDIYSEEGAGTAIKVFLPVTGDAPARRPDSAEAPPRARDETVLVVEDSDTVRALAVRILRSGGYTVVEAPGGPEGLAICEDRDVKLDLLLTDVIMPGMLGSEVGKRAAEIRPELPVLYMSGYLDPIGDSPEVRENLVQKPFNARELLERVRDALDRAAV